MAQLINHAALADALLGMVRGLEFGQVLDPQNGNKPLTHFPSIDLAVVAFPDGGAPVWANVLFSRDFPEGIVADMGQRAEAVANVRYLTDQTDAQGNSAAWLPHSNWDAMAWTPLAGSGNNRFVAPYPASLIKLMVAIGVGRVVDAGTHHWDDTWAYGGTHKTIAAWTESMIVASNNDATSAMVAVLHAGGLIQRHADGETNHLEQLFSTVGLHTLRLHDTQPNGGWRNGDGAGVGHLQMTAWDAARLLWLLADGVPAAPWAEASREPMLSADSRKRLWGWLADQGLHEILSSTLVAGVPGCRVGIPARLPAHWITAEGGAQVEHHQFPPDIRPANARATALFAHKTGNTDNYTSDAGLVTGLGAQPRKYLIAMTSNLGRRYAPNPGCVTDWRIAQLGAAVDAWMQHHLE
ncbi:MAG: hypothetical protein H7Y28_11425 [Rhodoferax sp.]|nr:hypothetical protein [Rhodoferax sp.]